MRISKRSRGWSGAKLSGTFVKEIGFYPKEHGLLLVFLSR